MRRALVRILASALRRQDRPGVADRDELRGNRFLLSGWVSEEKHMSKTNGRTEGSALRVLLSPHTISRRNLLLSSWGGAVGLALEAGRGPAMAAEGSLTSLTYSGQRWGAVQEGMAPA